MTADGIIKHGTSTDVAVKMLREDLPLTTAVKNDFLQEINLSKRLRHPHLVAFLGACTNSDAPLALILELTPLGSLESLLKKRPEFGQYDRYGRPQAFINTLPLTLLA